jgi:hypothetical protein
MVKVNNSPSFLQPWKKPVIMVIQYLDVKPNITEETWAKFLAARVANSC